MLTFMSLIWKFYWDKFEVKWFLLKWECFAYVFFTWIHTFICVYAVCVCINLGIVLTGIHHHFYRFNVGATVIVSQNLGKTHNTRWTCLFSILYFSSCIAVWFCKVRSVSCLYVCFIKLYICSYGCEISTLNWNWILFIWLRILVCI